MSGFTPHRPTYVGSRFWITVRDLAARPGSNTLMNRSEVIGPMRATCNQLSAAITSLHPQVPKLDAPAVQSEIIKALFELTRQVEVVKKHLIRLEKEDHNTLV